MFRVIFVLLLTTYCLGAVLSYRLHGYASKEKFRATYILYLAPLVLKCRGNEPITENCMARCIEDVGKQFSSGVPELDIPQYEPHYSFREPYRHTYNEIFVGNARLKNIEVRRISDYTIREVGFENLPESGLRISFFVHYVKLVLTAPCLLNGTLNNSFINVEDDKLELTLKDLDAYIVLEGHFYYPYKRATKHFKLDVVHVKKNNLQGSIEISLEHDNLNILSDQEIAYLQANKAALWKQIEPDLRVGASTFIRTTANNVFSKYPAQQLFLL